MDKIKKFVKLRTFVAYLPSSYLNSSSSSNYSFIHSLVATSFMVDPFVVTSFMVNPLVTNSYMVINSYMVTTYLVIPFTVTLEVIP